MSKPVVVIRNLEDSPQWLDRRLLTAYWQTEYRVSRPPGFVFQPGQHLPAAVADWLETRELWCWTFLSAWNPRSVLLPPSANAARHRQLESALHRLECVFWPAVGVGADGDWPPEESCWALNLPATEAVRLGRVFEQNAILHWEKGGVVELWWLLGAGSGQ